MTPSCRIVLMTLLAHLQLIYTVQVNKLFELLRLDRKLFPDNNIAFFTAIVEAAKKVELSASQVAALREKQWEVLQAKLEKVRIREQELKQEDDDSDGIEFSDEDDDEEDEAERLARLAAQ